MVPVPPPSLFFLEEIDEKFIEDICTINSRNSNPVTLKILLYIAMGWIVDFREWWLNVTRYLAKILTRHQLKDAGNVLNIRIEVVILFSNTKNFLQSCLFLDVLCPFSAQFKSTGSSLQSVLIIFTCYLLGSNQKYTSKTL